MPDDSGGPFDLWMDRPVTALVTARCLGDPSSILGTNLPWTLYLDSRRHRRLLFLIRREACDPQGGR